MKFVSLHEDHVDGGFGAGGLRLKSGDDFEIGSTLV